MVGSVAVDYCNVVPLLGKLLAAFEVLLDNFDGNTRFQEDFREIVTEFAAARDDNVLDGICLVVDFAEEIVRFLGRSDD